MFGKYEDGGFKVRLPLVGLAFTLTLEPMILMYNLGNSAFNGAQQTQNLLHRYACERELGLDFDTCSRLNDDEDIQIPVQKIINKFNLRNEMIGMWPAMFYVLVAGALSDRFGRKPLLILPMVGSVVETVVFLVGNWMFYQVPLWFFHLTAASELLGGFSIFFLGLYGFGSNSTTQDKRATRLARYDGVEQVSFMLGSLLSPVLFRLGGNDASFLTGLALKLASLAYLIWATEEPVKRLSGDSLLPASSTSSNSISRLLLLLRALTLDPLVEMTRCVFKRRPDGLRNLLAIMFVNYGCYLFLLSERKISYNFMLRVFDGFDGEDWAHFSVVMKLELLFGLLVVVPVVVGRMGAHESTLLSVVTALSVVSYIAQACVTNFIPDYYLAASLDCLRMCIYCLTRSLVTRCVSDREIGKCFSAIAVFASLTPLVAAPTFRLLYDATVASTPSAFLWLCAAVMSVPAANNIYLFTQRRRLRGHQRTDGEGEDQKASCEVGLQ